MNPTSKATGEREIQSAHWSSTTELAVENRI